MTKSESTAQKIRNTIDSGKPIDIALQTSQKILARITDGIYRQPASALRELISNAYDADAKMVTITTDAPRFSRITIKDDGIGISPEALQHLIENIGGSAKRTEDGKSLNITSTDPNFSPNGRKLIGKMGIGLFAVVQFTRHFLIITKCKGDDFRTIADVTLGTTENGVNGDIGDDITSGEARIWTEPAANIDAHGTEINLLELLPRTQAELCSLDLWGRIDYEIDEEVHPKTDPPIFHIGRMNKDSPDQLIEEPKLPWSQIDLPDVRFKQFVDAVRLLAKTDRELVDLDSICDNYFKTLWELALACPLDYVDGNPFDLEFDNGNDNETLCYSLENKIRGQSTELVLGNGETLRNKLGLVTPIFPKLDKFELFIDGVKLSRPIVFANQPKTGNAIKTPLLFVGKCRETFLNKPLEMSRGTLAFEAYLFWTPKVLPKQHQGVMLRVGNAAGASFDRTFMDYQVSEQTRLRQITAEIFVYEGLEGAINLDRESFNFSHPHYQFLVKWLHSAIRQLTNRQKFVGKGIREERRSEGKAKTQKAISVAVTEKLHDRGIDDVVSVEFITPSLIESVGDKRDEGIVAFERTSIFSDEDSRKSKIKQTDLNEQKATALTQLLYGWGLLDGLTFEDQARLVRDILEIVLMGETE